MTSSFHRSSLVVFTIMVMVAAILVPCSMASARQEERSADWWNDARVREVGDYTIRTDLGSADANAFLRRLRATYTMIDSTLGSPEPRTPEKLNVLVFAHRADYEVELRRRFNINAVKTGGIFFDAPQVRRRNAPTGRFLAIWVGERTPLDLSRDLQHEAFHQYAYSRWGHDLPMWVNEGLATFFAAAVHTERGFILGEADPRRVHAVKTAIIEGNAFQFTRMLTMENKEWHELVETDRGPLLYDQSWSMVQFLLNGDGGRYNRAFLQFLSLLREGYPAGHAFADSFGMNVHRAFEERWSRWARELKPTSLATAMAHAEFLAAGMVELRHRDIAVSSLDELRTRLRDMQFSWRLLGNGMPMTLNATSDEPFTVPRDARQSAPPRFELEEPGAINMSSHERELEERYPTPYSIRTQFLSPVNVKVVWVRHPDDVAHFDPVITLD